MFGPKQTLNILTGCHEQSLNIDFPQATQTKLSELVPLFGFTKEWFNPDRAFTHGFVVGWRLVISIDSVQIRLEDRAPDHPTVDRGRTLGFDWASITDFG